MSQVCYYPIKAYENGETTVPPHGDALRAVLAKAEKESL